MEHDLNILMIFDIKEKSIILTYIMYCWLLPTNIPQRLNTGYNLQGHIYTLYYNNYEQHRRVDWLEDSLRNITKQDVYQRELMNTKELLNISLYCVSFTHV